MPKPNKSRKEGITIEGIVSKRTKEPLVEIRKDRELIAQMSMAQARNIAMDILQMCSRTEADAIIHKFFADKGIPEYEGSMIMLDFREFRNKLDNEEIETFVETPSHDPKPN